MTMNAPLRTTWAVLTCEGSQLTAVPRGLASVRIECFLLRRLYWYLLQKAPVTCARNLHHW